MEFLHALFAILAAFRLTTLFAADAIWHPVRTRLPRIPWHCALCMSVWAGIVATVFLLAVPYLNWPLGLSWLYLAMKRGFRMESSEIEARVSAMQSEYELSISAASKRSAMLAAELTSAMMREKALKEENEKLKATHADGSAA